MWLVAATGAGLYCLARGAVDLTQRRYGWGVASILAGIAIFLVPLQSHAVKLDLIPAPARAGNSAR